MSASFKTFGTLSVLGSLIACAPMVKPPATLAQRSAVLPHSAGKVGDMPVHVAAAPVLAPGAPTAEGVYVQGRAAHGAGQLTQAAAFYEQVLRLAPDHVGALNALGVIHAQEGRIDKALALMSRAIALAPDAAYLYNNAGYALLRADRLEEAAVKLERARRLSPGSVQTAQNLALLEQARRQAGAAALATAPAAPARGGDRLVAVAPQVYELRLSTPRPPAAQAATAPAPAQAAIFLAPVQAPRAQAPQQPPVMPMPAPSSAPAPASLAGVQLEVANGVGIRNFARRTADRLSSTGVVTARLTNARPYRQMKTEIQFGAGQESIAQALRAQLPLETALSSTGRLHGGVQLRLVLGHDLKGRAIAAWLDGAKANTAAVPAAAPAGPAAALTGGGGWLWG